MVVAVVFKIQDDCIAGLLVLHAADGFVDFQRHGGFIQLRGLFLQLGIYGRFAQVLFQRLALAAGGSYDDAMRLANYAGGVVVMKRGTATVSASELTAAVESDRTAGVD